MVIDKIVLVKGSVPYSYFGAPESYNTTYNNEITVPETTDTPKDESKITKTFEPDILIGDVRLGESEAQTIPVYSLTGVYNEAVIAMAGYDEKGNMTAVNFAKADLSDGKANVQLSITFPSQTVSYEVMAFDSFANMTPIAPVKYLSGTPAKDKDSTFAVQSDLSGYIGKKSIVIIADTEITEDIEPENIKYIHSEEITSSSYKNISLAAESDKVYYIAIGIDKNNALKEQITTSRVDYTVVRELSGGGENKTTVIKEGTSYVGNRVSVSDLPIIIYDEGKYYLLSESADETFKRNWTLGEAASQTLKVTYTYDEDIVAYIEFEDFGKNVITNENYSKGAAGYLNDNTIVTFMDEPEAGKYELTASVVNSKGVGFKLKYGDNTDVGKATKATEWKPDLGIFKAEFTLSESENGVACDLSKLKSSKNGTSSPTFDYIIIRKVQ